MLHEGSQTPLPPPGGFPPAASGTFQSEVDVGSRTWGNRIRTKAKVLADQVEIGYLELGEILYRIYDAPVDGDPKKGSVLARWGFKNIGDYAERELNLHHKKAQRLMRIFYRVDVEMNGFNGDVALKHRFIRLGWSKARELVRVLTVDNALEWIERAEGMNYTTCEEVVKRVVQQNEAKRIQQAVAAAADPVAESNRLVEGDAPAALPRYGLDSPDMEDQGQWFTKHFRFEPSQAETVNLALRRAQDLAGNIHKTQSSLLSLICVDFLSGASDWGTAGWETKLRYLAKIEKVLGVKLVVVEPDTGTVKYGLGALELAARTLAQEPGSDPDTGPEGST